MAAQKAMRTVWLVVLSVQCAPAASFKVPMSSDEGPSFATFAFEHPPDVLRGATSESLYFEDSSVTDLNDTAAAKANLISNLIAKANATPRHDTSFMPPGAPCAGDSDCILGHCLGGWCCQPSEETWRNCADCSLVVSGPTGGSGGHCAACLSGYSWLDGRGCEATIAASAAPAMGAISAIGDPHLQNVHGERFDLMKLGKHVLLNIPRGEPAESALLRVEADARRLGGKCTDTYFQELNITGAWVTARQSSGLSLVEAGQTGGIFISARGVHDELPDWMKFGKVYLKAVHGRTQQGLSYLNFYVKHLGQSGFAVGGLLGEDDHTEEATPSEACVERLSLIQSEDENAQNALVSVAEASFD